MPYLYQQPEPAWLSSHLTKPFNDWGAGILRAGKEVKKEKKVLALYDLFFL